MVKEYSHYGVNVFHQYVGEYREFEKFLESNNVKYRCIPVCPNDDARNNVLTYDFNGRKFALLVGNSCILTTEVPEDGDWYNLYVDVRDQINGEEPQKMKTKARMILELAEKNVIESARKRKEPKTDEEKLFALLPQNADPYDVKMELIFLGYKIDEIMEMDHNDVDEEWLKEIAESKNRKE